MADANLLDVLEKNKYSGIKNLVLFGRVRSAIEKPAFLADLDCSNEGYFAILDTYAVKCLGEDYFAMYTGGDSSNIYFVKGSMLIYLADLKLVGENIKVFGAYKNKGTNVRKQFGAKGRNEGVSAFAFKMVNGSFVVVPNTANILTQGDTSIKGTALEEFVVSVVINKESKINYPESLNCFEDFEGISNPVVKDVNAIIAEDSHVSYVEDSEGMIDVSKTNVELVHHFAEGIEESELVDAVKEEIEVLSRKRHTFSKDIRSDFLNLVKGELRPKFDPLDYGASPDIEYLPTRKIAEDIVSSYIENIGARYNERIPDSKLKFKEFVDNLIRSFYKTKWVSDKEKEYSYKQIQECIDALLAGVSVNPRLLYGEFDGNNSSSPSSIPLLHEPIKYASLIISNVLGISEGDIVGNANECHRLYNMSEEVWFCMLIRNPYALGMLSSGLSIGDCDKLYFSFGRKYHNSNLQGNVQEFRNDLLFLENMRSLNEKDSFMSETAMSRQLGVYPWAYRRFVLQNGFPCKKDNIQVLQFMLGFPILNSINKKLISYNPYTPSRVKRLYEDKGVLEEIEMGGQKFYALSSDIEKEFLIYTKLYRKGQAETEITDEVIESCISEFEEEKGFKLEPLQVEGIHLVKYQAAVLSGCAGSGKTTVSDCITNIIKKAFPLKKVLYSTPTGKACRRLAEVTGGDVKTLHSRFGISIGNSPFLCDTRVKEATSSGSVYILDEMAMCSMDLLFNTVKNLGDTDIVYFLGDIKQLPTIGRGNPFKLLMTFLPCIELGVSKRAAEGSLVNYNTTLINNFSDNIIQELKYDDKTFIANECADADIPIKTASMFMSFMREGHPEDDIQVITGYQKEDCSFSAPSLNKPLHTALRKADKVLYEYGGNDFCKNERVIHVKRNAYEMPRYIKRGGLTYEEVVTFGAVNGEVGKITGMYRSDAVTIVPFDADAYAEEHDGDEPLIQLLELRAEKEENLIDNMLFQNSKMFFVEVTYYDVNLKQDIVMLYHAHAKEIGFGEVVYEGGDLPYLEYAYALTTHKMQGSQSPIVICVFGSTCNPMFINRNMINTMFTRSQGIVGVVGSVRGSDSPINQGRRNASVLYCKDMLSVLSGVLE